MSAKLPSHLFATSGALYDTRAADWSKAAPLRPVYSMTYQRIDSVAQFKATLRAGAYAWPGGYPMYFIASDCGAICFACARKEVRNIFGSISTRANDGWRIVATDINYEDTDLQCDNCSKSIEAAYSCDEVKS